MEATITKTVPFSFPVEIVKQQTEEGALHIVGYAAATVLDRQGDIITSEALKAAAQDLLKNPTLFLDHDPKRAIGRIVSVSVDKNGLLIDAIILIEGGFSNQLKLHLPGIKYTAFPLGNLDDLLGAGVTFTPEKDEAAGYELKATVINAVGVI